VSVLWRSSGSPILLREFSSQHAIKVEFVHKGVAKLSSRHLPSCAQEI